MPMHVSWDREIGLARGSAGYGGGVGFPTLRPLLNGHLLAFRENA